MGSVEGAIVGTSCLGATGADLRIIRRPEFDLRAASCSETASFSESKVTVKAVAGAVLVMGAGMDRLNKKIKRDST